MMNNRTIPAGRIMWRYSLSLMLFPKYARAIMVGAAPSIVPIMKSFVWIFVRPSRMFSRLYGKWMILRKNVVFIP